MIIEIKGVQFVNKGAELMLRTITYEIRQKYPNVIFVLEVNRVSDIPEITSRGYAVKLNLVKKGVSLGDIARLLPASYRKKKNIITDNEIDVVLDSSGFAYGDFWGAEKARIRMSGRIKKWKKQKKKIILLPQAFGPFESHNLRKQMRKILAHADLIFARDRFSKSFLDDINPSLKTIRIKPDFTNLLEGKLASSFEKDRFQVAIIPNLKMIEAKVFDNPEKYYKMLILFINNIKSYGLEPYFLLHERGKDRIIADEVNSRIDHSIAIVEEEDPVRIKGVINTAYAVVGSRFHGLVSALSQAVPTICIGWSHKYEALMEDYCFQDGFIDVKEINENVIKAKLKLVLEEDRRNIILPILEKAADLQKQSSRDMWNEVFTVIDAK